MSVGMTGDAGAAWRVHAPSTERGRSGVDCFRVFNFASSVWIGMRSLVSCALGSRRTDGVCEPVSSPAARVSGHTYAIDVLRTVAVIAAVAWFLFATMGE